MKETSIAFNEGKGMQRPVGGHSVPSEILPVSPKRQPEVSQETVCFGLVGAAAIMVAAVGVRGLMHALGRRRRHGRRLAPRERTIIKQLIAHGERKRWDFSYDENFLFNFLPLLKKIVR